MAHPREIDERAGRRLSRAPRARLSRRLHALAGAVAQAAGRALGRPRAVGGAAPRLRPRERDRAIPARRNTGRSRRDAAHAARRAPSRPASSSSTARSSTGSTSATRRRAEAAQRRLEAARLHGRLGRERSRSQRNPPPPFTTSTLQQEAARKLGFDAQRTMQHRAAPLRGRRIGGETVGLITYMRTDGVDMAPEAHRRRAQRDRRPLRRALPAAERRAATRPRPRTRRRRTRRSARPTCRATRRRRARLERDQARLYELIWKRTSPARWRPPSSSAPRSTSPPSAGARRDAARHRPGHPLRRLPRRSTRKAATTSEDDEDGRPPARRCAARRARCEREKIAADQHFTEPPPRYTEAIADQEDGGARHRPALDLRRDPGGAARPRLCAASTRSALVPEDKGRLVTAFLESFFQPLRRIRFHRRPGGEARPHLRRRARLEGRAARLLAATSPPTVERRSRICASPRCSTR